MNGGGRKNGSATCGRSGLREVWEGYIDGRSWDGGRPKVDENDAGFVRRSFEKVNEFEGSEVDTRWST